MTTEEQQAEAQKAAAEFEAMLVRLDEILQWAKDKNVEYVTIPTVDLASLFLSHETVLEHLELAAGQMLALDAQAQAAVNICTALVLRFGGEVRIKIDELAATHGAKLSSGADQETMEQVITVTRVDPDTGQEVGPSRIIVPGRLPLGRAF